MKVAFTKGKCPTVFHMARAPGLTLMEKNMSGNGKTERVMAKAPTPLEKENLEALVANHVLLRFPNVIVTPHVAYNTHEAVARIIETTIENIEAFAMGSPKNLIV